MNSSPVSAPYTEPWLRGTHTDVPAVGRAVLHALELALDDIRKWTDGLTDTEVHAQPLGLSAVSFHIKHIARSTDRILTYAEGGQLTPDQLAAMKAEQAGAETLAELLAELESAFSSAETRVRTLAGGNYDELRGVGRKQLPTSMGGALIHVADHTQRHTGQVVTTAKLLRALRAEA
ncbi:DinB family protein [Occallatibacter riparius]|uniref:DinB family protein n=1 Tax=Occallatibacter riparius TaxID=1002689 RepID=A0A9J7BLM7_9BACT|nr:DinB family protein [Occallatibacter riparius]UWZ82682.1 DinB family protein [Occallatibacter riparius]